VLIKIELIELVEVQGLYLADILAHQEVEHLLQDIVEHGAVHQEHRPIEVREAELEATEVVQEPNQEVEVHIDQAAQVEAVVATVHQGAQQEAQVVTGVLVGHLDPHTQEADLLAEVGRHLAVGPREEDLVVVEAVNKPYKFH